MKIKKHLRNTSRLNFKSKLKNCFSFHSCLIWAAIVAGNFKNFKKHFKAGSDKVLGNIVTEGH